MRDDGIVVAQQLLTPETEFRFTVFSLDYSNQQSGTQVSPNWSRQRQQNRRTETGLIQVMAASKNFSFSGLSLIFTTLKNQTCKYIYI